MPQGGRALGWFPNNPLKEIEIQLQAGDVIVYYTDGLTDAENPEGVPYGETRLATCVQQCATLGASDIRVEILKDVEKFCAGNPPFDDLTMLVVRYTGG
jgi:sigma-B regulation protein RsbU (phosphoserine phosphatase)